MFSKFFADMRRNEALAAAKHFGFRIDEDPREVSYGFIFKPTFQFQGKMISTEISCHAFCHTVLEERVSFYDRDLAMAYELPWWMKDAIHCWYNNTYMPKKRAATEAKANLALSKYAV